jgi:hypothetical protein
MAFWNEAQIEPKRKFKFLLTIDGATQDETIPSFVVKKVTKPSFSITEGSHQFLGNKFYYPGKLEWKEIDLTIVDVGGFEENPTQEGQVGTTAGEPQIDITSRIINILSKFGYQQPNDVGAELASGAFTAGSLKTFSKFAGTSVVPAINIQQLDSNGGVIEKWTLNNAWIKEVNFGELDYSSEDNVEITLKLRYDWATFTPANSAGA